jgi:hypothetical protein
VDDPGTGEKRVVEGAASMDIKVSMKVRGEVDRALDEIRLGVLGILVAIGLTVGFGVHAAWYYRVGLCIVSVAVGIVLLRCGWSRKRMMSLMAWVTGGNG